MSTRNIRQQRRMKAAMVWQPEPDEPLTWPLDESKPWPMPEPKEPQEKQPCQPLN